MSKQSWIVVFVAVTLTVATVITWQATGGDWYTKYEVVEQVQSTADPNDPLASAGFYDGGTITKTVTRDEFRFGLLPAPERIFDKHALSVTSIVGPAWVLALGLLWHMRRRRLCSGTTSLSDPN